MEFRIADKYRLEIHWRKSIYERKGTAKLVDCYLSGPVIKEVTEMNEEDHIALDFGDQYLVFVDHYYIVNLYWKGLRRTPDKIYLDNVVFDNKFVNSMPKLNDEDFILVDTKDHEEEKHQYTLTYPAYLIKKEGDLYNFGG